MFQRSRRHHLTCIVTTFLLLQQAQTTEAKWVWKQDSPSSSDIREGNKENSITFGDIIGATVKFQKEKQALRTPLAQDYSNSLAPESELEGDVANIQEESSGFFQLDVHHPDSPYGLIQDVLKPVFRKKPQIAFLDNNNNQLNLGGLDSNEVWLSQGDLLVLKGGVTNTGEDKWPPLDNYQAPYREPILAPTTNSLTNSNGIISILPAPAKFNMQTNRLPRNIFLPSILLNPSKPAQKPLPPAPMLPSRGQTTESGFVPVTPSWLSYSATHAPKVLQNPRFYRQNDATATQHVVENTTQKSTYNNLWSQIASPPATPDTQVQRPRIPAYSSFSSHHSRPHTNRRPQPQHNGPQPQQPPRTNIVTVKHGIFPIHKSRRRPRIFHPLSYFY